MPVSYRYQGMFMTVRLRNNDSLHTKVIVRDFISEVRRSEGAGMTAGEKYLVLHIGDAQYCNIFPISSYQAVAGGCYVKTEPRNFQAAGSSGRKTVISVTDSIKLTEFKDIEQHNPRQDNADLASVLRTHMHDIGSERIGKAGRIVTELGSSEFRSTISGVKVFYERIVASMRIVEVDKGTVPQVEVSISLPEGLRDWIPGVAGVPNLVSILVAEMGIICDKIDLYASRGGRHQGEAQNKSSIHAGVPGHR